MKWVRWGGMYVCGEGKVKRKGGRYVGGGEKKEKKNEEVWYVGGGEKKKGWERGGEYTTGTEGEGEGKWKSEVF